MGWEWIEGSRAFDVTWGLLIGGLAPRAVVMALGSEQHGARGG